MNALRTVGAAIGMWALATACHLVPANPPTAEARDTQETAEFDRKLFEAINRDRAEQKLQALRPDPRVQDMALDWARHLAVQGKLAHRQDLAARMAKLGFSRLSENVLLRTDADAAAALRSWLNSPRHRKNLRDPNITLASVASARAEDGTLFAVFNGAQLIRP